MKEERKGREGGRQRRKKGRERGKGGERERERRKETRICIAEYQCCVDVNIHSLSTL